MKLKINRDLWKLVIGITLVLALLAGQAQATIGNDGTTIYIYGVNAVHNLSDINTSINNASVLWNLSGIWYLNKSIRVNGTSSTLIINSTDAPTGVRFASDINNQSLNITVLGIFLSNDTSFSSWNHSGSSLQWTDGYKAGIFITGTSAVGNFTNVSFKNMGKSFSQAALRINAPKSVYVNNSNFSDGYGGIYCTSNCVNVNLTNNSFRNNTVADIYIDGASSYNINVTGTDQQGSSIPIILNNLNSSNITLSNLYINGTNNSLYNQNIQITASRSIVLSNVMSTYSYNEGLTVNGSRDIIIRGGNYSNNRYQGVYLSNSTNITIDGIISSYNLQGVKFFENVTNSLIANSSALHNIDDGFSLQGNSSNNTLNSLIMLDNRDSLYMFKHSINNTIINTSFEGFDPACKNEPYPNYLLGPAGSYCYDIGFYSGLDISGTTGKEGQLLIINPIAKNNNFSSWPYPIALLRHMNTSFYNYTLSWQLIQFTDNKLIKYNYGDPNVSNYVSVVAYPNRTEINITELQAPFFMDILNGYIIPSSNSISVNVTAWNTTGDYYKKVNATGNSNTAWEIGDNPINTWMNISVNGTTAAIKSNSSGYLSFGIDLTGLGESQVEISVDANPPGSISQHCISTEGNVNAGFMLLGVLMVIFSVSGIVMSFKSNESMNPVMIGAFFAILVIGSSLIYIGYAVIVVLEGTTC